MSEINSLQIRANVNNSDNVKSIEAQIQALSGKIKSAISIKLNIDSKDIQFLSRKIDEVGKKINNKPLKFLSLEETSQDMKRVISDVERIREEFKGLGKNVQVKQVFDNANEALKKFDVSIENTKNNLKEIQKFSVTAQYDKEGNASYGYSKIALDTKEAKAATEAIKKEQKAISEYEQSINKLIHSYKIKKISEEEFIANANKITQSAEFQTLALKKQEQVYSMLTKVEKTYTSTSTTEGNQRIQALKKEQAQVESLALFKQKMLTTDKGKGQLDILGDSFKGKINSSALTSLKNEIQALTIDTPNLANKMKSLNLQVSSLQQQASKSGTALSKMAENAFKFLRFYLVGGALVSIVNVFRNGIENVKSLDEAITNMSITMNLTTSDFDKMTSSAQKLAKELGSSVKDVLQAAKTFANMNESIDAILEKTRANIMLSNLSGSGIEQTTDSMQGIKEQFELLEKDSMRIADTLTFISANLAMDFSKGINEVTDGIKVSGSMAREAGFELERYESVLGSVVERTRLGGSTVANAAKTIFARLGRVNDPDLASDEDISKAEKAYRSIGIALRDMNGQFREIPKVLDELNTKWTTLTSTQKSYIAEQSAGVRQKNIFINMVESWTRSTELYTQALNANGFATERNAIFMDSIQGRMKQFTATSEIFWQDFISTDLIKNFISALDGLVSVVDTLVNNSFASFLLTIGLTTTAFHFLGVGLTSLKGNYIATSIGVFALDVAEKGLIATTKTLTASLLASPLFWVAGATVAIYGIVKAVDYLNKSFERQKKVVSDLTSEYTELDNQLNQLKGIENRTEAQETYLQLLEKELKTKQQILAIEKQKLFNKEFFDRKLFDNDTVVSEAAKPLGKNSKAYNEYITTTVDGGKNLNLYEKTANRLKLLIELQKNYNNLVEKSKITDLNGQEAKSFIEYQNAINLLENALSQTSIKIKDYKKDNVELNAEVINVEESIDSILNILDNSETKINSSVNSIENLTVSQENLNKAYENSTKSIDDYQSSAKELSSIYSDLNEGEKISADTLIDLIQKYPEYASQIANLNNSKEGAISLTKLLFEVEKNRTIQKLENDKMELKSELDKLEGIRSAYLEVLRYSGNMSFELALGNEEYENILKKIKGIEVASNLIKNTKISTYSPKQTKTSPSVIEAENLTDALIKSYNAQVEIDKSQTKSLERQIKTTQVAKDYTKEIELQNKLLINQNKTISDLKIANDKLHLEAEKLRQSNKKYNTESWFDINGEATLQYRELLNSFAGKSSNAAKKEKQAIEDLFDSLYKLKQGWISNTEEIYQWKDAMDSTKQNIQNLVKSEEDLLIERNKQQQEYERTQADKKLKLYKETEEKIIDLLKKKYEKEENELDKSLKKYKDYVDGILDENDRMYATEDYEDNIKESTSKINEIQSEINKYALAAIDGQSEAITQINELTKNKTEEEKRLKELQRNRERELIKQNLVDNQDAYETDIDNQKEALQEKTSETALQLEVQSILAQDNIETVQGFINNLFDITGENATKAGQIIQNELISKLKEVISISKQIEEITNMSTDGIEANRQTTLAKMEANASIWGKSNLLQRKKLENENLEMGHSIGLTRDDATGIWYDENGIRAYEGGGKSTSTGLALLHGTPDNPEWVLNSDQMSNMIKNLTSGFNFKLPSDFNFKLPSFNKISTNNGGVNINMPITVTGNLDKAILPELKSEIGNNIKKELNILGQAKRVKSN